MAGRFKRGDWARLNSGGPPMFVFKIEGDLIAVTWLHDDGTIDETVFSEILCQKVDT